MDNELQRAADNHHVPVPEPALAPGTACEQFFYLVSLASKSFGEATRPVKIQIERVGL